ncbi:hypothetical protein ACFPVY_04070 [Flavobacterium qiangtangense]|uniref:Tail fiber-like repeat protein n=1 Tax=Flavobacterium qiangtangense TaxID=1442595 RepID=A0ABW1PJU0_9FLAO
MQNINVGATPNSGNGAKLRDAMIIVNDNFSELQDKFFDYSLNADLVELSNEINIQIQDINEQIANLPAPEIPTFQQVVNQGNQVLSPDGRSNFTVNFSNDYPIVSYRSESSESSAYGGANLTAMELYMGSVFFASQSLYQTANLQLANGSFLLTTGSDIRQQDRKVVEISTQPAISNSKIYFPQPAIDNDYVLATEQFVNDNLSNIPAPNLRRVLQAGGVVNEQNSNLKIDVAGSVPGITFLSDIEPYPGYDMSCGFNVQPGYILLSSGIAGLNAGISLTDGAFTIQTSGNNKITNITTPYPLSNSTIQYPQPTVDGIYKLASEEFVADNDAKVVHKAISGWEQGTGILSSDLNDIPLSCIRRFTDSTLNRPFSFGTILTTRMALDECTQLAVDVVNGRTATRKQQSGVWSNWVFLANDTDVLHKTGVETIQDNKLIASSKSINFFNERYGIGTPDAGLQIYSATFDNVRFGARAADLSFTEHARMNGANGFFGLGVVPTERLDVDGNGKFSGKIFGQAFEAKSETSKTEIIPTGIQTTDTTDPALPTTSILKLNKNGFTFNGLSNNGDNTVFGYDALKGGTGGFNTALGIRALNANTTGQANTALGQNTFRFNTTGQQGTAVGYNALGANTTGRFNVAVGYDAMRTNTIGEWNTAIGMEALRNQTNAVYNVAVGYRAGRNATEGTRNTFLGVDAGSANTIGGFNLIAGMGAGQIATHLNGSTILGQAAGNQLTSAENNTFVGRNAGANITTGSSNLVLAAGNFIAEGSGIIGGNNNTIVGTVRGLGDVSNNVVIADGEGNIAMRKDSTGVVSFPSGSVATDEIIMTSPNGTRWRVRIDDAGTFSGVIE